MKYTYKFDGGQLDCELACEPGETGSRELGTGLQLDPDYAVTANLVSSKLGGVDVFSLLSMTTIWDIEEKAICND